MFWNKPLNSHSHICSVVMLVTFSSLALSQSLSERGDTLSSVHVFTPRSSKYLPGQPFSFLKFQSHVTLIQGWWLNWNVLYCEEAMWRTHSFLSLSPYTHTYIYIYTNIYSFCIYNFYIQFTYVNIAYIQNMCVYKWKNEYI